MKLFISMLLVSMFLSGCITDGLYGTAQRIYIGSKEMVVERWDKIPGPVQEKLKKADEIALTYDEAREMVKKSVESNSTTPE